MAVESLCNQEKKYKSELITGIKMDILTFITEVIKALAWPVTLVLLLVLLKEPLSQLLVTIRSLKYKDFEFTFTEEMQQIKGEIPEDIKVIADKKDAMEGTAQSNRLKRLLELSPRLSIIEAWRIVELAAIEVLQERNALKSISIRTTADILRSLEESGLATSDSSLFFQKLYRLRNQASHSKEFSITEEDARSYTHNALSVVAYLKSQVAK